MQHFGLPVGLLVSLCVFLWRLLIWLKPFAERAIEANLGMISAITVSQETLVQIQGRHTDTLGQIARTQQQQVDLEQQNIRQLEALRVAVEHGNALLESQRVLAIGIAEDLLRKST